MSTIAIITARSKSKRIPHKNIKPFCGKPIMVYSIEAALSSNVFDEVMVSTDSEQYAEIAKNAGAKVPFLRSPDNSSDHATTADVLIEVIKEYEKIGRHFDEVCCIYPTAPFISAEKLSDAFDEMKRSKADSLVTVVKFGFPPQRGFVIRDNHVSYLHPEFEKTRSQDLEPIYHDCGQFYIIKTEALLQYHSLVLPNTVPYILPEEEVQDIDTLSDWEIAEAKFKALRKKDSPYFF